LARILVELIRDPRARARLGAAALAQVRDQFDPEKGYDRLAELLRARTG
jgi:glycosyltransferase involved in cell wall biosynthesis